MVAEVPAQAERESDRASEKEASERERIGRTSRSRVERAAFDSVLKIHPRQRNA
jgi:hypothetical protein